jgi:hypothetical protein
MNPQSCFDFKTPRKVRTEKLIGFNRSNLQCAEIILRDVERYGGEDGVMVRWARAVICRVSNKTFPPANVPGLPATNGARWTRESATLPSSRLGSAR